MSRRYSRVALLAGGFAVSLAAVVVARGDSAQLPGAVKRLLECHAIAADPARLACYDAAANELSNLLTKGEIVAVDREQVRKVRRQAFGFTLPSLSLLDRSDKPDEIEQVTAVVANARQRADGNWILTLEDGAVWIQIERGELSKYPHKGSKAEIRKAAMGSFFINLDGQRAIRAKRVE